MALFFGIIIMFATALKLAIIAGLICRYILNKIK